MKRYNAMHFFMLYSYAYNIVFAMMELLPDALRRLIFKMLLHKTGHRCFIDYRTYFRYPGNISMGDNVVINRGSKIYASYYNKESRVVIGNNVAIGPEVSIFCAGHDIGHLDLPDNAASVVIEDDVWIGGRSVILQGVTIGKGAVVAGGSVVVRSIPPFTVVAGNPATIIKKRKLDLRKKPGRRRP